MTVGVNRPTHLIRLTRIVKVGIFKTLQWQIILLRFSMAFQTRREILKDKSSIIIDTGNRDLGT